MSLARWFRSWLALLITVLIGTAAATTTVSAATFTYDGPPVARDEVHEFHDSAASPTQLSAMREPSASPPATAQGTPTTPFPRSVATKPECSFSGDTEVLMADGSRKRIDQVVVGDMVIATDPVSGETKAREVLATLPHEDVLVTLGTSAGAIVTTEDHRYWNLTDGEWQAAEDLDRGDRLLAASGAVVVVEGLDWGTAHITTAYDLDVQGIDTFYVGAGGSEVLVHNCNLSGATKSSRLVPGGVSRGDWWSHAGAPRRYERGRSRRSTCQPARRSRCIDLWKSFDCGVFNCDDP